MPNVYPEGYLTLLRQKLNEHFSKDELRTLCFDIDVDPEELGSDANSKSVMVLNLITYLQRRKSLDSLIRACEKARPQIPWRASDPREGGDSTTKPPSSEPSWPPERERQLRIFLCHATQDKTAVRELYTKLLASGFEPWLDEEKLLAGQDWELEITRAIRESHVIIVCLSQESVSKTGFVQKEIRFALDRALEQPEGAIFLIPLKLTPCEVPLRLKPFQWVNYYEENGYQNLVRALRARADKS
jgi:hypothetical protein